MEGKVILFEDMAITLLSHLPNTYSNFYSSLITSGRMTDLTWEELAPMVLDQEDRFKNDSGSRGGEVGLTGQGSKNQQQKKKQQTKGKQQQSKDDAKPAASKKEVICFDCGVEGHIRRNCPKKSTKGAKDPKDTKEIATVA